jgi:2-polyprenyl-6-methoxyphenol hydroxylase-like FAD-dependent oxidoreductase
MARDGWTFPLGSHYNVSPQVVLLEGKSCMSSIRPSLLSPPVRSPVAHTGPVRAEALQDHDRWGEQHVAAFALPRPTTPDLAGLGAGATLQRQREGTVLTVGASIAGLCAGIALKEPHPGREVVCAELRSELSRLANIAVKQGSLDALARLGIPAEEIAAVCAPITRVEILRVGTGIVGQVEPEAVPANADAAFPGLEAFLRSPPVALMRICDVEKLLYTRAVQLGVRVLTDSTARLDYDATAGLAHATLHVGGTRPRVLDMGTPDLVFIADGAGGRTAASVGLTRAAVTPERTLVSGLCDLDVEGLTRIVIDPTAPSAIGPTVSMVFGNSRHRTAWFVVEVPDAESLDVEALRRRFCEGAARVLGREAPLDEACVLWGARSFYRSRCELLPTASLGENVAIGGDAIGHCGGFAALGMNLVAAYDFEGIAALAEHVPERGPAKGAALHAWSDHALAGRRAWIDAANRA